MSEKYKVRNPEALHFITLTVIDWVDLFTRPAYKHIIINSLKYCQQNKGLELFAYVIMPSHVHMIAKCKTPYSLSDVIRDFKKFTNIELIKAIQEYPESRREWLLNKFQYAANRIKRNTNYKIWQDGFHPVELSDNNMMDQRLDYIHNNPVKDEIVNNPEDYRYSSAPYYAGLPSELTILKIE